MKSNGRHEPFNRNKIILGMQKACSKRPIPTAYLTRIVDELEVRLRATGPEISSRTIGEMVVEKILQIDGIAYLRFASVFGRFTEIDEFRRELDRLEGRAQETSPA